MIRGKEGLVAVIIVLLTIAGGKLGGEIYRWYAYAPERAELARLEDALSEAGLGVIGTQVGADTLRRVIERLDTELSETRRSLSRYDRLAIREGFSPALETLYEDGLSSYNERVAARNALFSQWRSVVDENHGFVERYNRLVDSIRVVAQEMGEPYYPIHSPAEIAERYGLLSAAGTDPE